MELELSGCSEDVAALHSDHYTIGFTVMITLKMNHVLYINRTVRGGFGYTIYNKKYFSERYFSYIVRVLTWRAWRHAELLLAIAEMLWIRALDTPSRYEWGVGGENVRAALRPIGQNCRAVCKRKGGAMRSRTLSEARH